MSPEILTGEVPAMPKRNSKHMSDPGIGKLPKAPKGKRTERFDSGADGLCLRITDRGSKTWCISYHFPDENGETKHYRLTIGSWPAIGVAEARDQARLVKSQARSGIDPRKARAVAVVAAKGDADRYTQRTFEVVAERYIKDKCPQLKRSNEIESVIRRLLLPRWKNRQVGDIKKRDARDLTDKLIAQGKPAAAHKLHETTVRLFNWMLEEYDTELLGFEISPLANLKPPATKKERQRKLEQDEWEQLWQAWTEQSYPFGTIQKFLLLTGTRRSEVGGAVWPEFGLEKRQWLIPAARTKNNIPHLVPLSDMAMNIIESLPRFSEGPFLFSTTGGKRPVSGFSRAKTKTDEILRRLAKENEVEPVADWRVHDLRRVVRSGLSRLRVDSEIAERILNHVPEKLRRTYDLYEYEDEKTEALARWAQEVRNVIEPPAADNVVQLEEHG